jgi:hypothetical protein
MEFVLASNPGFNPNSSRILILNPEKVLKKTTIIKYSGTVQYETIGELIHQFKNYVHVLGVHIGTYKKILLVMIESLENMMKYGEWTSNNSGKSVTTPLFAVIKNGDRYFICSENTIAIENIDSLEKRLHYLNSLTPEGIKEFYKETITNGQFSQQGGAGLGLIEMAKVSGNKIEFGFNPVNDKYSVFNLKITVDEFPVYPKEN